MLLGAATYTVQRDDGTYVAGVWTPSTSTFTINGSIQPAKNNEAELLPEGARVVGAMWLYCEHDETELRTVNLSSDVPPDRIIYDGQYYEIHGVGDWTAHQSGLPHRVYALTRVGNDDS